MYLALISEPARQYFLELANKMMLADGEAGLEEEAILEAFKYECEMPEYQPKGLAVNDILPKLAELDNEAKNAVMLELTGLAMADESINPDEHGLLLETAQALQIAPERIAEMKQWVIDMNEVANRGMEIVEHGIS